MPARVPFPRGSGCREGLALVRGTRTLAAQGEGQRSLHSEVPRQRCQGHSPVSQALPILHFTPTGVKEVGGKISFSETSNLFKKA